MRSCETVGPQKSNSFSCMGESAYIFDVFDSSEHVLFVVVGVQIKLRLMTSLEGIYSNLDIMWTYVETIGNIANETFHLLEVGRSH